MSQDPEDNDSSDWSIEIDKSTNCRIASAGVMPEMGYAFVYDDDNHHFYFYANRDWHDDSAYDVVVKYASVRRFAGPPPNVPESDMPTIKRNITKFFEQRDFSASKFPLPPTENFRSISFEWQLSKSVQA